MSKITQEDFEELAEGINHMREFIQAMVAGLVSDGFSKTQARQIVVAIMTRKYPDD